MTYITAQEIALNGTVEEQRLLFEFDKNTDKYQISKKFWLFAKSKFSRYFTFKTPVFHYQMIYNLIDIYTGNYPEYVMAMFRGSAKTSLTKLFLTFVILNDKDHQRKYFKVLSKDGTNGKQIVVDIFNNILELDWLYPDRLEIEKKGDKKEKRELSMTSFTTSDGIKISFQTLGTGGRGNIQDAYRPDFLWFEDIEDMKVLRSPRTILNIKESIDEAITGKAPTGAGIIYTVNYLSEAGNVHRIIQNNLQLGNLVDIIPIADPKTNNPTWPEAHPLTDEDAAKLQAQDGIPRESIEWLKKDAKQRGLNWEGEYMANPLSEGELFFNLAILEDMEKNEVKEPVENNLGFKIYTPFINGHRYAGGFDISKGVGLDSSTSVFIDFTQFPARVVATYHNNTINPVRFGGEMARQGKLYGTCLLAPENNYETAAINELSHIYPSSMIYKMKIAPKSVIEVGKSNTYGWNTNSLTKGIMLQDLKTAIEDGHLIIPDKDLIQELKSYNVNDLYDRDIDPRLTTRHFDMLIALAIAWQMRNEAKATDTTADRRMKLKANQVHNVKRTPKR